MMYIFHYVPKMNSDYPYDIFLSNVPYDDFPYITVPIRKMFKIQGSEWYLSN